MKCCDLVGSFGTESRVAIGPDFQYQISNLDDIAPVVTPGANVNVGGANVDGATLTVLGPVVSPLQYLIIGISGVATSGEDNSALFGVLRDPAGGTAWQPFINDLVGGFTPVQNTTIGMTLWYHFPVSVPAGATLGAHGRKNGATGMTAKMVVYGFGLPANPGQWWYGSGVETLGAVPSTSKGTLVTPVNGSYGAYATLGSSTKEYRAIQAGFQFDSDTLGTQSYLIQLGVGSSPISGVPVRIMSANSVETASRSGPVTPIFRRFASGTSFQARSRSSGAVNTLNACLYGVHA